MSSKRIPSTIYLHRRNETMDLKLKRETMLLARARDELIERPLIERRLSFMLAAMRQKIKSLPGRLRGRLGPERFPLAAVQETERQSPRP